MRLLPRNSLQRGMLLIALSSTSIASLQKRGVLKKIKKCAVCALNLFIFAPRLMRALFGDFRIFILLLFSFNAPNAAPSRHKVPIFTHFFFSSLSLFVSVCVICGGKHGVSAFCKFSQRYFFVNRELAGAVFCAGILRLRAHLKAKAVLAPRSGRRALARQFFCLEAEGEEMPLGGEERAASVGLRRAAGGDCSVLKFWR